MTNAGKYHSSRLSLSSRRLVQRMRPSRSVIKQHSYFDRFKVKLSGFEQNGVVMLDWQYDAPLFRKTDIEQLAAQFQKLLAGVVEDPGATSMKSRSSAKRSAGASLSISIRPSVRTRRTKTFTSYLKSR